MQGSSETYPKISETGADDGRSAPSSVSSGHKPRDSDMPTYAVREEEYHDDGDRQCGGGGGIGETHSIGHAHD